MIDQNLDVLLAQFHDMNSTTVRQYLQAYGTLLEVKPYLAWTVAEQLQSMDLSAYPEDMRPLMADDVSNLSAQVEKCKRLYLAPTECIDYEDESVSALAADLARQSTDEVDLIRHTDEYIRDQIRHSYDGQLHAPTARASEVLRERGSICWGKANLLAALLRANGIPSGISYELLTKGDTPDTGYMPHALNTVYVNGHGWVRCDARGNKEGVNAEFLLDGEKLAFVAKPEMDEVDYRNNLPDADPILMRLVLNADDMLEVSTDAVLADFKARMRS